MTAENREFLTQTYGVDFKENPLPIWDKLGGKIILLVLLGFALRGIFSGNEEEDQTVSQESTSEPA